MLYNFEISAAQKKLISSTMSQDIKDLPRLISPLANKILRALIFESTNNLTGVLWESSLYTTLQQ